MNNETQVNLRLKAGKEALNELPDSVRKNIELYLNHKIKDDITQKVYESVKKSMIRERIKELKSIYKDADTKQKQAQHDDIAWEHFQAKKQYIADICKLENLDFLLISGRKDAKN